MSEKDAYLQERSKESRARDRLERVWVPKTVCNPSSKSMTKGLTIWRRLNSSLIFFILLLLLGIRLAWWMEKARSDAAERSIQIDCEAQKVRLALTQMNDSLRGILLDPQNDPDKKLGAEAEKDLAAALDKIQSLHGEPELVTVLGQARDFAGKTLALYQGKLTDLQEADPGAAVAQYAKTQAAIRKQREQMLHEFDAQMDRAKLTDSDKAARASALGFLGLAVVLLASAAVGTYQASALTEPLVRLVGALERLRHGDFSQRLAINRRDEFGLLGEGLNRLADDLSVLVGQMQRSGLQVNTTATEIAATAKQQQSTANEIAATTAEIGATSRKISATSRELVKTMNEVNEVAAETARAAGSGQASITSMEAIMRQIMEASGSITAKLAVLNEKTSNINSVVTTITKVADQTNLLSLNAAIEAEKAGEYGLGFAVVAMEIRRLADQTAVATYDIEKMVKEMQSAVSAGVMGMDKFSEEVRHGVEEIRQVGAQQARIIHQVQELTPRFQTVNEGMRSQATGAQQISETLMQLSEAAQQTVESLWKSNQAIEQLNAASRGLQTSVTRFKLEPA